MPAPNTPSYDAQSNPTYMPAMRHILSITNALNAVVTTTVAGLVPQAHGYKEGFIVRLVVPSYFGMEQAHNLLATIIALQDTEFTLDLDTAGFDPFVVPPFRPGYNLTPAQVIPVGSITRTLKAATRNVL